MAVGMNTLDGKAMMRAWALAYAQAIIDYLCSTCGFPRSECVCESHDPNS